MAGIYIHIPFCKTKCLYCDFYSLTTIALIKEYKEAVCEELKNRKDYLNNEPIETIYIGGGTPSLLPVTFFQEIFDTIYTNYTVLKNPEITFEANPDDLSEEYISALHSLPVNRLSIGVQSFIPQELTFLNRRHSVEQVKKTIKDAKTEGFKNISIDLIYGLPGQTLANWDYSLEKALDLFIQHVSAYHLIYEEETPLFKKWKKKEIIPVEEQLSNDMFELLMNKMSLAGFQQYEISNFAKQNYISRHNSSYWKRICYLGIGASAHSYNKHTRSFNPSHIENYIKGISEKQNIQIVECIDNVSAYNEFIITSLRTMQGLSIKELETLFGEEKKNYFIKQIKKYLSQNLLEQPTIDIVRLTKKGIFVSDGIMADLLIVENE